MNEVFNFLPNNISKLIYENASDKIQDLEEIRIRRSKPIILKCANSEIIINHNVNR